ncbi:MAG: DUF4442 domain-containing protein [Flavobacteriaceae bacterium]|nr:DUF4442 domain-containing protein [Flavobacteriaceae bacterium]
MKITPQKINSFLFFKLPAAFFCGVRVKELETTQCITTVRHRWINQNPFNSMYFAVQAMAAELSTGALVMMHIKESNQKISMLVANQKGNYNRKATGKITFSCNDGEKVVSAIEETIRTGEGVTFWMTSIGKDKEGEVVSTSEFEWRVKISVK